MQLFYLFILVVVLVIWGLWYVLKGIKNGSEELKAIPISDPKEIHNYKQAFEPASEKSGVSQTIAEHIIKENVELKTQLAVQEKSSAFEKEIQLLRDRVEELNKENLEVKKSFEQERIKQVTHKEEALPQIQLELMKLKESNERLGVENARLTKSWEEDKKRLADAQTLISGLEQQLNQITVQDHLRIQTLEEEVKKFNQDQDTGVVNKHLLDRLSAENLDLLFQIKEKEAALNRLSMDAERLTANYEVKLSELNERLDSVYKRLSNEDLDVLRGQYQDLRVRYEFLTNEKSIVDEECHKLKEEIKNVKSMHEIMQERDQFLQYELTKTKAQLLGLERLCEDFKTQIESAHNP
jgi:chromosome segregation ATPase